MLYGHRCSRLPHYNTSPAAAMPVWGNATPDQVRSSRGTPEYVSDSLLKQTPHTPIFRLMCSRVCREAREEAEKSAASKVTTWGESAPLLRRRVDYPEVLALEFPAALRTVRELLPVGVARFEVVEEHPKVVALYPPELAPHVMTLPARATRHDHPLTS